MRAIRSSLVSLVRGFSPDSIAAYGDVSGAAVALSSGASFGTADIVFSVCMCSLRRRFSINEISSDRRKAYQIRELSIPRRVHFPEYFNPYPASLTHRPRLHPGVHLFSPSRAVEHAPPG